MSSEFDKTKFASYFDFETKEVSVADLVQHLRVMGMEPEGIGLPNAMAALAAADLISEAFDGLRVLQAPGYLIQRLRNIDFDTWGEVGL